MHTPHDPTNSGDHGGGNARGTASDLATLHGELVAADRAMARAVAVVQRLDPRDVIRVEGQVLSSWLRTVAGCTIGDEKTLVFVARRLAHLPTVARWFAEGVWTWAMIRASVYGTRNLTVAQLGWLDDTLAANTERAMSVDPDTAVGMVHNLADQARADLAEDRAARQFDRRHLRIQTGFDGSVSIYGEFDAETGAAVLEALDTTPTSAHDPDDGRPRDNDHSTRESTDTGEGHGEARRDRAPGVAGDGEIERTRPSRAQRRADALLALCLHRRATSTAVRTGHADGGAGHGDSSDGGHLPAPVPSGHVAGSGSAEDRCGVESGVARLLDTDGRLAGVGPAAPAPARPSVLVTCDVHTLAAALTATPVDRSEAERIAHLLWRSTRGPAHLADAAIERLACDGDLRVILTDGHTVLGTSRSTTNVGAPLRAALTTRDGQCRFPACSMSPQQCVSHHIVHRAHGGPTILANLLLLCSAHHHAVHDGGWTLTLHDDATVTFTNPRGTRSWTTQPRTGRYAVTDRPPPRGRPRRRHTSRPPTRPTAVRGTSVGAAQGRPPNDGDLPF